MLQKPPITSKYTIQVLFLFPFWFHLRSQFSAVFRHFRTCSSTTSCQPRTLHMIIGMSLSWRYWCHWLTKLVFVTWKLLKLSTVDYKLLSFLNWGSLIAGWHRQSNKIRGECGNQLTFNLCKILGADEFTCLLPLEMPRVDIGPLNLNRGDHQTEQTLLPSEKVPWGLSGKLGH
jgi:hypothetical protein